MSTPIPALKSAPSEISSPSTNTPDLRPQLVQSAGLCSNGWQKKFRSLFPKDSLKLWLEGRVFYERGFTPLIALWYLVFGFLDGQSTLEHIVEDARNGGADRLSPRAKRLSKTLRSDSTSSWATARQRLPLNVVHKALIASGQTICSCAQSSWRGLRPVGLDGTTYRITPHHDIPEHFPAHKSRNKSKPYWSLARSVAAFCMTTGAVLDCALDSTKISEQALAWKMFLDSLWTDTLFVADRNFGVYSVVRAAVAAQAHILVRMTKTRAKKVAADAKLLFSQEFDERVQWTPTRHDKCREDLAREPVSGRLIAVPITVRGFRSFTLYLFTTLTDAQITVQELVQLYGQRWQVELNLRHIKTQLNLHTLHCKSADMSRKLWLAGLMAYNLVRAVMTAAATTTHQSVFTLSFSRSLKALKGWLPKIGKKDAAKSWDKLLQRVASFTLPKRKHPRPAEPRAKRPSNSHFPKLVGDRAKAREKLLLANANF